MKRYIAQKSYREETDENPEIIETDNAKDNEAVQTTSRYISIFLLLTDGLPNKVTFRVVLLL